MATVHLQRLCKIARISFGRDKIAQCGSALFYGLDEDLLHGSSEALVTVFRHSHGLARGMDSGTKECLTGVDISHPDDHR